MSALCLCGSVPALAAPAVACGGGSYDERVVVDHVYDGDSLRLADGRKLRLIGINTPELRPRTVPGRAPPPPEPLAYEAQAALRAAIGNNGALQLRFDDERKDRYGRILAHAYLPDGRNVAALLLEQGLGMALVVPPNLGQLSCYRDAENAARSARRGLWASAAYQPLAANQIEPDARGFRLVAGRVREVSVRGGTTWITLSNSLALRIRAEDLRYFEGIDISAWRGRSMTVRGWLTPRNGSVTMKIRHPAAVELHP